MCMYHFICFTVCQDSFSEGLFWRTQSAGQIAHLRCSEFHPSLKSGVFIGRMCGLDSQWGEVDFTNCTMDLNASPFIHVELQMSANNSIGSLVNTTRDRVCTYVGLYAYVCSCQLLVMKAYRIKKIFYIFNHCQLLQCIFHL